MSIGEPGNIDRFGLYYQRHICIPLRIRVIVMMNGYDRKEEGLQRGHPNFFTQTRDEITSAHR